MEGRDTLCPYIILVGSQLVFRHRGGQDLHSQQMSDSPDAEARVRQIAGRNACREVADLLHGSILAVSYGCEESIVCLCPLLSTDATHTPYFSRVLDGGAQRPDFRSTGALLHVLARGQNISLSRMPSLFSCCPRSASSSSSTSADRSYKRLLRSCLRQCKLDSWCSPSQLLPWRAGKGLAWQ